MRLKMAMIILVILLAGKLSGSIKVAGSFLIPTAGGREKPYKGVLTITRRLITIECDKKIFQPFNEFDVPKQKKLKINTSEVFYIEINGKEKKIYLRVDYSFVSNYRNILHLESRFLGFSFATGRVFNEFWAIIFTYEKLDPQYLDQEIINSINNNCYQANTKHCLYNYYP